MKKRCRIKPLQCVVLLSAEKGIRNVSSRENGQLENIIRYANGHNIRMIKILRRAELGANFLHTTIRKAIGMVALGMANGILIENMRCIAADEEDAGKWIGAFSKAGGAIYSVDDGKFEFHFKNSSAK